MRFWKPRPRTAIVLICICAVANFRMARQAISRHFSPRTHEAFGQYAARFEPLRASLPAGSVTGYILDTAHADPDRLHPDARFALAQYALAPRLVERSARHPLVIVDGDGPRPPPESLTGDWTLVTDLGNGVRLYRTPVKE
jgi:hypothetical protein